MSLPGRNHPFTSAATLHCRRPPPSTAEALQPHLAIPLLLFRNYAQSATPSLTNTMNALPKRKTAVENSETGIDPGLITLLNNGEDLGPIVRHAFEVGKPESLLHQLKFIVKKKEVEIEELCKLHYEDFILAVDELRGVLLDADDLKSTLSEENTRLQEAAGSLLLNLEQLLRLFSIKKNVTESIKSLKVCIQVLKLCVTCNRHISNAHFHSAINTLNLIEKDYLRRIPTSSLQNIIEKQIPRIKNHIEKKVCSEFNDWLVRIRTKAKEIGQLAIGQAASARQRDEEMRVRQREAEEESEFGFGEFVYTLDVDEIHEESVLEFDLTPVYRAHHIHTVLGIEERFREYYYENRLMQLNLDLEISTSQPFVESHQPFFAHIAGFYIVEDQIFRTTGGLLSEDQWETIWNLGSAKMTSILENQFSSMDTTSHLLIIKDFVTLLGATLGRYGYKVTSLIEVLDNSRDKYHELLLNECREQLTNILSTDKYEQMVIRKEYEYNMNVLAFNLHSSDILPMFPYVAPFSSSVPDSCRIIRSFIDDSVSYLSYGGQMDLFDTVKKYLDRLLIDVLNEFLLSLIHGGTLGVSQVLQIAANIAVFERGCDLFLWQIAERCGIPMRLVGRAHSHVGLTAKSVLKASQNAAYGALANLVNSKLDDFLGIEVNINWVADEDPQDGNEFMNEVVIFLEALASSAQQILPLEALYKLLVGALEHISDTVLSAFLSENVKRFTRSAVFGIDIDLKKLESFAEESFQSTGLSNLKKDKSLMDCLTECRQLVNLLLSDQPDSFTDPEMREKSYGVLDYKRVARICEKFKDSADGLFGSLSNRNAKQSARKKSMDILKKRLKDYN